MTITILPYDSAWNESYKKESSLLKGILKDLFVDIYHIGGTAVKGLASRPIIDIMAVVKNINAVEDYEDALENIGYECLGEFGLPGCRYYRKQSSVCPCFLHIFDIYNEKDIIRFLAFRDYLRKYPEKASFYGEVKQALAEQFPEDIEAYSIGKSAFIDKSEMQAVKWYISNFSVK